MLAKIEHGARSRRAQISGYFCRCSLQTSVPSTLKERNEKAAKNLCYHEYPPYRVSENNEQPDNKQDEDHSTN